MSERSRERIRFGWNSLSPWLDAGTQREVSGDARLTTGLPLSHADKYGLFSRNERTRRRDPALSFSPLVWPLVWPLFSRHFPLDDESFNGRAYFRIDPRPRRAHHHHEPPTLSSSGSSVGLRFRSAVVKTATRRGWLTTSAREKLFRCQYALPVG